MNEKAIFAGGCFWCTEALFASLKGVIKVTSGYIGGETSHPTYEQVSTGTTGHAEAVEIEYDSSLITYEDLLAVFFTTHDPTTLNQQGADIGTQYRSAIFVTSLAQKVLATELIQELNDSRAYEQPVVTTVEEAGTFYEAEEYHKNYYQENQKAPYCQIVIAPKLQKLHDRFKRLITH